MEHDDELDAPETGREWELRAGMPLWVRFTLFMTLALTVVMAGAGFFLYRSIAQVARSAQERSVIDSLHLSAAAARQQIELERMKGEQLLLASLEKKIEASGDDELLRDVRFRRAERERVIEELTKSPFAKPVGDEVVELEEGRVQRLPITYGPQSQPGVLYRLQGLDQAPFDMILAGNAGLTAQGLLGLIVGMTLLVILGGAAVSVAVANQVSGPIEDMVDDVREIATGDLAHRTRPRGAGELVLLARSIDKMTKSLAEARETELELQIREREVAVAGEVREALLPQTTPQARGYEIGALHLASQGLWGDFHDFIELGEDRMGLLVCDVSGKGLPGALVGATARSYLRTSLSLGGDVKSTLQAINRDFARDIKRGMFVSVLYVLVDPAQGIATVACAGHKIPLVRYTAADKKVRLIHPEGIALAFDKGPIFDRALQVQHVPIERGDRLVLANSGAVSLTNEGGAELGEKPLYAHILRHGGLGTDEFLERMRTVLEAYSEGAPLQRDISIVTIARS